MAKFELKIYDPQTGEVEKIIKRGFMPLDIYVRFQKLAERAEKEQYKSDEEMFVALREPILELFPELTTADYGKKVDIAEVLALWKKILDKASEMADGDESSKNA